MPQIELSTEDVKKLEKALDNYLTYVHRSIIATDTREAKEQLIKLEQFLHGIEEKLKVAV
ncbi:hypothetical protein [Syntrophorhabdus aromaticivorans]|jgi:hypothetical protein|uniref:hypothetical protein n=1 Tax=Syntrophorhabdus aromaticivorans TaxID=328301 RepID=UPI000412F564|nr:hypothetical protein [Syntrophorhabdus aromaticivorans]